LGFEICKLHTRPQNKFQEGGGIHAAPPLWSIRFKPASIFNKLIAN